MMMMMMMMMIIIIAIIIIIVIILFYFHLFIPFFENKRKKRTPDTFFFFFAFTNVFVLGEVRKRKMRTDKGSVTELFVSKTKIRKCFILNCVYVSFIPLHIK